MTDDEYRRSVGNSERAYLAAKWMLRRKKESGRAEMNDEDVAAWAEMVRNLPGWTPGARVVNGITIQEMWRTL